MASLTPLVAAFQLTATASGQDKVWIAGTGTWNTHANWSPYGYPGSSGTAGDVEISNGGRAEWIPPFGYAYSRDLFLGRNAGNGEIHFTNGELNSRHVIVGDTGIGRATFSGSSALWYTHNITVGNANNGRVELLDGAAIRSFALGTIGAQAGSDGEVYLRNASKWTLTGNLLVADAGNGYLLIENGSAVYNAAGGIGLAAGSEGLVNVYGTNAVWTNEDSLSIGVEEGTEDVESSGELYISAGGRTVVNGVAVLGAASYTTGYVTVDGAGSTMLVDDDFSIGDVGYGDLLVKNQGVLTSRETVIGNGGGGLAVVEGAGSRWDTWQLEVGYSGAAQLDIKSSGKVTSFNAYLGYAANSEGTVNVGTGGTWECIGLRVGRGGKGNLSITDGGTVTASANVLIGGETSVTTGDGTVDIDGATSKLIVTGSFNDLTVGSAAKGTLNLYSGTVSNRNGRVGTTTATSDGQASIHGTWTNSGTLEIGSTSGGKGTLTIWDDGTVSSAQTTTVRAKGTLTGSGALTANVTNQGVVAPFVAFPVDPLNITGNYTQSSNGRLKFELDQHGNSRLDATGNLTLAGTLEVVLGGGWAGPTLGRTFDLLNWGGSLSGTFGTLQLPSLGAGFSWETSQLYASGVISIVGGTTIPGDFSGDGRVDSADYIVWRNMGGSSQQFEDWRSHFGQSNGIGAGSSSSLSAVPEPGAATFAVATFMAAWRAMSRTASSLRGRGFSRRVTSVRFRSRLHRDDGAPGLEWHARTVFNSPRNL